MPAVGIHRVLGGGGASSRAAPYPSKAPSKSAQTGSQSDEDKENRPTSNTEKAAPPAKKAKATKEPDRSGLPENYLDIHIDDVKGEVPVYEDAAAIRRKLNKLLDSKEKIPGTKKAWSKASLSTQLCAIADRHHPVKCYQGADSTGPSSITITRFLKKSGSMGGGDSPVYYYAHILLEKLRIWNGEKKTKGRLNAEEQYPNGRVRCDPDHMYFFAGPDMPPPSYTEVANRGR